MLWAVTGGIALGTGRVLKEAKEYSVDIAGRPLLEIAISTDTFGINTICRRFRAKRMDAVPPSISIKTSSDTDGCYIATPPRPPQVLLTRSMMKKHAMNPMIDPRNGEECRWDSRQCIDAISVRKRLRAPMLWEDTNQALIDTK